MSENGSVIGNAAQHENPEVGDVGEAESGTDAEEFGEDRSQKCGFTLPL